MLLTREEMTYDFGGARLDPHRDRALLAWMMNQFLYGEVTGIQCGHWLYDAPDLEAARFFSRQAVEEFQHVDNFLRILSLLGAPPARVHGMVRFLTSGMMPGPFEEHVCLEMALGEGFVLMALYGVIDTLGPRGGNLHSPDEYVVLSSLTQRAQLTALLLLKLATGEATIPRSSV